jgi:hypothetical protein
VTIETPPAHWEYAAIWNLQGLKLPPRSGFIRVRLRMESGSVGISANKKGDFSALHNEIQVVNEGRILEIDIDIEDTASVENLVIRNVSSTGSSNVSILAISVL